MAETLTPKPYARLYKMLGEDLIKDEKTALIELIKNAYDADATWVAVNFRNFGNNFRITKKSEIIIEDNGVGMTEKVIKEEWINPATPNKKNQKNVKTKTAKGRILQGEKGIGRYSMFKLGKTVELRTKSFKEKNEISVSIDLSKYNDEFVDDSNKNPSLYFEDVDIIFSESASFTFQKNDLFAQNTNMKKSGSGTRLTISNLLGDWNAKKAKDIYFDIAGLQSISPIIEDWKKEKQLDEFNKGHREFTIFFLIDGIETPHRIDYEEYLVNLLNIIKEKCFLEISNGFFNDKEKRFYYDFNGEPKSIKISDPVLRNLPVYKRYFIEERENFEDAMIQCGPFSFEFYIFLFDRKTYNRFNSENFQLNDWERDILKKQRIYLYRDDIRVYPYGEPKDDWLQTDTLRGLISAGDFFSNDQVVGFIKISYLDNPNLQDKTNREGLIENGEATSEFIALIQTFLSYLRIDAYVQTIQSLEEVKRQEQKKREEERKRQEELRKKMAEEQAKKAEEERKSREAEEQSRKDEEQKKKVDDETKGESRSQDSQQNAQGKSSDSQKDKSHQAETDSYDNLETEIEMRNKKKNLFFKRSDVLKSSIEKSPFYVNHNELIEQLSSLRYEKHYLLFVLSFRVLIEDMTKRYLVGFRNINLRSGLGENVSLMIDDILITAKSLTRPQQATLTDMLGGHHGFNNHLTTIKEEFYKNAAQGSLSIKLNSLSHSPRRINEDDALDIANNKILPLIVISEKLIELTAGNP